MNPSVLFPFGPAAARDVPRSGGQWHKSCKRGVWIQSDWIHSNELCIYEQRNQAKIRRSNVGEQTVAVPLEKILAQLSRGVVTITFGELRHAAAGVFAPENDRDRVLVPLPLAEILTRLNPALITRRRVQRTVEVPE